MVEKLILVIADHRIRVLQHIAGQDADHVRFGIDHTGVDQLFRSGHRAAARRFRADSGRIDHRFRVHDLLLGHGFDHAVAPFEAAQGLFPRNRVADLDRCRDGFGVFDRFVGGMVLPHLVERGGTGGLNHRDTRNLVDDAEVVQLLHALGERGVVAEVASRNHEPVRHLPVELLEHFKADRLLPFDPERVDRVEQIDVQFVADLLDQRHRIVEVAADLQRFAAEGERLGELAVRDLAFGDEDHRTESGNRRVAGHRCTGVAGAGAGDGFRSVESGGGGAAGHAAILEAAGGVFALMLELEVPEPGVDARLARVVEAGVALLPGYDLIVRQVENKRFIAPDARTGRAALQGQLDSYNSNISCSYRN